MYMQIVVGQAVRKKNFWDRKYEMEDIWEAIESGSHILLVAPRRVGKTSIMYKIVDEPKENYIPLYLSVESADSENEFWKKLFNALREEEFLTKLQADARSLWRKITNIEIKSISIFEGVEFGDGKKFSYKEAFYQLIKDLDNDKKIIIMIDEFAQSIENIIKNESEKNALSLLQTHRVLRQDTKVSEKITFVYAGSIGLETIVSKIGVTKHINDLNSIKISSLSKEEATQFIDNLAKNNGLEIPHEVVEYLLEEIAYFVPFYIQLMVQELKRVARREPTLTTKSVDKAIENALENRQYFENWKSKLKSGLSKEVYLFAKEILNTIATNRSLTLLEIIEVASSYEVEEESAKDTLDSLVYDGYINNNEDKSRYQFNSPILRKWWSENVH